MEEWREVRGYEGLYEVSNTGKVRSVTHYRNGGNQFGATFKTIYRGRELEPQPRRINGGYESHGHLRVSLTKNGKTKKFFIHRLVAIAFIPNPYNLPIVNHIDENQQNNNVTNLEWCDQKYNMNYGTCRQRGVMNTDYKARAKKQNKKVYQYDDEGNLIKVWNSRKEASEAGFTATAITRCAQGKRKHHKGYVWSFQPIPVAYMEKRFFGVDLGQQVAKDVR